MFSTSACVYENAGLGGKFSLINCSLPMKLAGDLLSESKDLRPKPVIKMALDVSGSMKLSMPHVIGTSIAAVDAMDDGSTLSIYTFDHDVKRLLFFEGTADVTEKVRYFFPLLRLPILFHLFLSLFLSLISLPLVSSCL